MAAPGLHQFLLSNVIGPRVSSGMKAIDLGCGSGDLALAVEKLGASTTGADREPPIGLSLRVEAVDFDRDDLVEHLGTGWDMVTAVEVIEHLESPIGFLRQIRSLLGPDGLAIVTTPHTASLPARGKFAVTGRLRMFDRADDPTHISPIFRSLLPRYLERTGLRLVEERLYPPAGFVVGRPMYQRAMRPLGRWLGPRSLAGDILIMVLSPS
jgi:SAM-dependent methyltransferase